VAGNPKVTDKPTVTEPNAPNNTEGTADPADANATTTDPLIADSGSGDEGGDATDNDTGKDNEKDAASKKKSGGGGTAAAVIASLLVIAAIIVGAVVWHRARADSTASDGRGGRGGGKRAGGQWQAGRGVDPRRARNTAPTPSRSADGKVSTLRSLPMVLNNNAFDAEYVRISLFYYCGMLILLRHAYFSLERYDRRKRWFCCCSYR